MPRKSREFRNSRHMSRRNLNPLGNGAGNQPERDSKSLRAASFLDCGPGLLRISGAAKFSHADNHAGILHARQQVSCRALKLSVCHNCGMTEDQYKHGVGRRLRIAAEAVATKDNISLAEVARRIHISPSRLGNYFRGDHYPNAYHVFLFCQRFGVTADYIYRDSIPGLPADLADLILGEATGTPGGKGGSVPPSRRKK